VEAVREGGEKGSSDLLLIRIVARKIKVDVKRRN